MNIELRSANCIFRFSSFLVLVLCCSIALSQTQTIDSLATRLQADLHDTDRVNVLNDLAWKLMYRNPDTSIALSTKALLISDTYGWRKGTALSTGKLGTFNVIKGNHSNALKYYNKALKLFEEQENSADPVIAIASKKGISSNLANMGIVYRIQGNYPKALEQYFKSLKMDEELDSKFGIAANLNNIGGIYYKQGDYPKALEHYFKALKMEKKIGNKGNISINMTNIGVAFRLHGDYPKALEYYFGALRINEEMGNKNGLADNLGNIGTVYFEQKNYTKALEYYFKSLKLNEELGVKSGISHINGNIGAMYIYLEQFEKAEDFLQQALLLSLELGAKEHIRGQYQSISSLYEATDRPAKAFEAYKLYIIYRDSIANEANTKAQTRTEMKYEFEKAELVKKQEEQEASRQEQEATTRRDNLQYSVVLICLLIIGVIIALLGRLSLPERIAEGIIFFSFLILFEFLLVLADPYIENWSGGAPGFKLLFNAGIAALIFPLHSLFEGKLKGRFVKESPNTYGTAKK